MLKGHFSSCTNILLVSKLFSHKSTIYRKNRGRQSRKNVGMTVGGEQEGKWAKVDRKPDSVRSLNKKP